MLHQIELYQMIPKFRDMIEAFEHETCCNMAVCEDDKADLAKNKKSNTKEYQRAKASAMKYHDRLKHAKKTKDTLIDLQRCLHE